MQSYVLDGKTIFRKEEWRRGRCECLALKLHNVPEKGHKRSHHRIQHVTAGRRNGEGGRTAVYLSPWINPHLGGETERQQSTFEIIDLTLPCQHLGLSGELKAGLNLYCLSRRTWKSEWNNSNVTECTNQSQIMKNRRIWEEPLCMRLERGEKSLEGRSPNTAQEQLLPVHHSLRCTAAHRYKCWTMQLQNQGYLYLENASLCAVR